MVVPASLGRLRYVGYSLGSTLLLTGACGGQSLSERNNGHSDDVAGAGGTANAGATGGPGPMGTGGSPHAGAGGSDTGCDECPGFIDCADGARPELMPGDCCPSCVPEPPDACEKGRAAYVDLRAQLVDKYGSITCNSSAECALVQEDNLYQFACPIALPSSTTESFKSNIQQAEVSCSSCRLTDRAPILCETVIAACVNGRCTAQLTG